MILVESEEYLFSFSNAHYITFENDEVHVYYRKDNIMKIQGYDTVDTSNFDEYFFKYEKGDKKMFFNKFSFLYLKKLEDNFIQFNFFDNFSIEVDVDYNVLISQA